MCHYMIFKSMHPVKSGIGPVNMLPSSHLRHESNHCATSLKDLKQNKKAKQNLQFNQTSEFGYLQRNIACQVFTGQQTAITTNTKQLLLEKASWFFFPSLSLFFFVCLLYKP